MARDLRTPDISTRTTIVLVTIAEEALARMWCRRREGQLETPMPPGMMHKDVNDTDQTVELIVVEMK